MEGLIEKQAMTRKPARFPIRNWEEIAQMIMDLHDEPPATFHLFQDDKWWAVNFDRGRFAVMFFLDSEERSFYLLDEPVSTSNDREPIVIGGQTVEAYRRHIIKDLQKVLKSAREFFDTGTIDTATRQWEQMK